MSRAEQEDAEIEASRAPLLDHLTELRSRLVVCVAAFLVGFVFCFIFADQIYVFLLRPFALAGQIAQAQANGLRLGTFGLVEAILGLRALPPLDDEVTRLIFTAPLEFLFTKMKLAAFGAIVITFPVLAFQLYRFVAPGLYRNERGAFLPFLVAAPVLFLVGAAMVYYLMLPFVMWFSLSQQISSEVVSVELLPRVSDYLNLVTALLLAFGLCFQLPVVLTLLGMVGIVSSKALAGARRYAVVGVFVVAAIVTPPDPISQTLLALPILLLYEASIWCVRIIEMRRRLEEQALEEPA